MVGLATAPGLLAKAKVSLERCHSTQTSQRKSWVSSYPNVTEFMRSRGTWHRPAGTLSNTGQPWPASTVVWKGQGENDHSRFSCLIRTQGFVLLILEQEGETERKRDIDVREKHLLVASYTPPNWRSNPQFLVYQEVNQNQPTEPPGQGPVSTIYV